MKFSACVLGLLCALLTGCTTVHINPGVDALQHGMEAAGDSGLVIAEPGDYGDQTVTNTARTRGTVFVARPGAVFHSLNSHADNVLYSGFDIDAQGDKQLALDLSGDHAGLHNSSVGNVTDEKGAIVSGRDITLDHVLVHDVEIATEGTHNEGIFVTDAPGLTIQHSDFVRNATFDVFFTHCFNTDCPQTAYGGVTLRDNHFGVTHKLGGEPHFYSVMAAYTGPSPAFPACGSSTEPLGYLTDWTVVDNTFDLPTAYIFDCEERWVNFTASGNVEQ